MSGGLTGERIREMPGLRAASATFLLLTTILALAPSASAAYLQAGYDAARTGNTPDAGPVWDDVAFTLRLPGTRFTAALPLIFDGAAYVRTGDIGYGPELSDSGIWRIDLATGAATMVLPLEPPNKDVAADAAGAFASDGEWFYVLESATIRAYAVAGGPAAWTSPLPDLTSGEPSDTACGEPAIAGGVLYFFCEALAVMVRTAGLPVPPELEELSAPVEAALYVIAIEAGTGEQLWTWHHDAASEVAGIANPQAAALCGADETNDACRSGSVATAGGIAVIGDHVIFAVEETGGPRGVGGLIAALDAATGQLQWMKPDPGPAVREDQATALTATVSLLPTGDERVVFARLLWRQEFESEFTTRLMALNPARGEGIWDQPKEVGKEDSIQGEGGSGFAFDGRTLYATSFQSIYRVDDALLPDHRFAWTYTIPPGSGDSWQGSSLVLADGVIYARAGRESDGAEYNSIYAIDAGAGTLLWRREFVSDFPGGGVVTRPFEFGLGEGVLVVAGIDGTVTVLGRTAASIVPSVGDRERYPASGSTMRVDLAATRPGAMGTATSFRADWGDGAVTEWQASPVFEHAYDANGDRVARFFARNDAGQSSSEVVTFHVGQAAPNFLSTVFAPEQQERTFFVLGLVITALVALVGILRSRRRQGRLERELRAVDELYQRTRHDPLQCEAAMRERKAHANGLLADRRITETQFTVLAARVDELSRQVRLGELDQRFKFLPMGMVDTLRSMLGDGRIEQWERDHFLLALEQDALLSPEQKAHVRRLIDGWFARDSGGGPA